MRIFVTIAAAILLGGPSEAQILTNDDFASAGKGGNLADWMEVVSGTGVIEHDDAQGGQGLGAAKLWTWAPSGQSTAWRCVNVNEGTDYALSVAARMDLELVAACGVSAILVDGSDCPNQAPILQVQEVSVLPQLSWHRRYVLLQATIDPTPGNGMSAALLLDHDRTSGATPSECLFDDVFFASDELFSGFFE